MPFSFSSPCFLGKCMFIFIIGKDTKAFLFAILRKINVNIFTCTLLCFSAWKESDVWSIFKANYVTDM